MDDALDAAGIDRSEVYVTNAVKHFKWKARGKRRIHDTKSEIDACSIWLQLEFSHLAPDILILLGATAAKTLLGPNFRITQQHGIVPDSALAPTTIVTIPPPRSFANAAKIGKPHTPRRQRLATRDRKQLTRKAVRRNAGT